MSTSFSIHIGKLTNVCTETNLLSVQAALSRSSDRRINLICTRDSSYVVYRQDSVEVLYVFT